MIKKIILIVLVVLVLGIGTGIFYLNKVFLPLKLKIILTQNLSNLLQRKVEIGSIRYQLFEGLIIDDLRIFEEPTQADKVFLTIKKTHFNILFLPLIKSKTIIIPTIYLDSPLANIKYKPDKTWNIPIPKPTDEKIKVVISRLIVTGGRLSFQDQTKQPYFVKEIENLNTKLVLSLPNSLKIDLRAFITNTDRSKGQLTLKGKFNLKTQGFNAETILKDIPLNDYSPYYGLLPVSVSSAKVKEAKILTAKEADLINLEVDLSAQEITLSKDNFKISGALKLKGAAKYSLSNKGVDYYGYLDLDNTNLEGIPFVNSATNIKGRIDFSKDMLKTDALTAQIISCPVEMAGKLSDFNNPFMDLSLKSKVDLEKLDELLKRQFKDASFDLSGNAFLDSKISGYLKDINSIDFESQIKLISAKLSLPQLASPIEEINGNFTIKKESASWQNLSLKYNNQNFNSNGELKDFANPLVETTFSGPDLNLKTAFNLSDKNIGINYLDGGYFNSKFNLKGALSLRESDAPLVNLGGTVSLDLTDIKKIAAKFNQDLSKIKLEGIFKTAFSLSGVLKDPRTMNISLNAQDNNISFSGYKFSGLSLGYNQSNAQGRLNLSSDAYAGNLNLSANLNLADKDISYAAQINLNSIDISRLKQDTALKDKDISGALSATASLNGKGGDLSKLTGGAELNVANGNLWELNLFKGLGKLLFPRSFGKIIFKEAKGQFFINNKSVTTHDLKLNSNELELAFDGSFDFGGNLDFKVFNKFSEQLLTEESQTLEKIISSVLTQTGSFVVVRLTGTFLEPKYKIEPQVGNILEGIMGIFNLR